MIDSIKIYNKTTDQSITLDRFSSRFLLDDEGVDWGVVTPTLSSYPSIYGLGSQVSNITFQKSREITMIGWIINDHTGNITQKKKLLNNFANPNNEVRITAGKYYIDGFFKTSVKYSTKRKENNDIVCKFQLSFTCMDPFFRLITPISYEDIQVNHTSSWQGWEIELNNTSGISYGFELYVRIPTDVTVTYLAVRNLTTGKRFQTKTNRHYTGDNIYLNTVQGKFLFGQVAFIPRTIDPEDFDDINMASENFEFIQLTPGLNKLEISAGQQVDLKNSLINVYFSPIFMGFEEM